MIREIIKGKNDLEHILFIAIDYSNQSPYTNHKVYIFNGRKAENKLSFSKFVDALINDWAVGIDTAFNQPHESFDWNINDTAPFTPYIPKEKLDHLILKAKRNTLSAFSTTQKNIILNNIQTIAPNILALSSFNNEAIAPIQKVEQAIKNCLQNAKIQREGGVVNPEMLLGNDANICRDALQQLYKHLDSIKGSEADGNYNNLYTQIEDCYALSRTATEWKETRDAFIEVQKNMNTSFLSNMQRAELNARLQQAFETLSKRQTDEKANFATISTQQYNALKEKIATLITEVATSENFDLSFNNLIITQNKLKETRLVRTQKDELFDDLNIAFTTLKARNKQLSASTVGEATIMVDDAIAKAATHENFKEARICLIDAQNALREYRFSRSQKDELFNKIRAAFDILNQKQDVYFKARKEQQSQNITQTLHNLTRIMVKKEEGMEALYEIRDGLKYKVTLIKPDKNSEALIASFKERLAQLEEKIVTAEVDINNLRSKVQQLEKEANYL